MARDAHYEAEYPSRKKKKMNRKKRQRRKVIFTILAVLFALVGLVFAYGWS